MPKILIDALKQAIHDAPTAKLRQELWAAQRRRDAGARRIKGLIWSELMRRKEAA
jgi:hypothetical protein